MSREEIVKILSAEKLTAIEIARKLGKQRAADVNPVLYAMEREGLLRHSVIDGSKKSVWEAVAIKQETPLEIICNDPGSSSQILAIMSRLDAIEARLTTLEKNLSTGRVSIDSKDVENLGDICSGRF